MLAIRELIARVKANGSEADQFYAEQAEKELKVVSATTSSLELALKFYADQRNYSWREGGVPINVDLGGKARNVLELLNRQRAEREARVLGELGYGD